MPQNSYRFLPIVAFRLSSTDSFTSVHLDIQTSFTIILRMKMLTIRMPEELHRAFKLKCVAEGQEMGAVVNKLIESYLKEKPKKQK